MQGARQIPKRLTYLKSAKSIRIAISISLRVTDDEKHLIQSYAASHHLSISFFIRDIVLDQLE